MIFQALLWRERSRQSLHTGDPPPSPAGAQAIAFVAGGAEMTIPNPERSLQMAAASRTAIPQYLVGHRDRLAIFFGQSLRAGLASSSAGYQG